MRFVPVDELMPDMVTARDLVSTKKTFMLAKGTKLTTQYIEHIVDQGYIGLYIDDDFSRDVELEEAIDPVLFASGVNAVKNMDVDGIVQVATEIVAEVSAKDAVRTDLIDLRSFDDYTYHHCVNVGVYSVIIGKHMGLNDDDLEQLTQAAICHDLGKSKIPPEVLNKPGKLTDEEYAMIKDHPQYSFDILYGNDAISAHVRRAILFHHENENGSGYPMGKEGHEIPLYAKIIHVADVYDALTSRRPYKAPYAPAEALDYLINGRGILFDDSVIDSVVTAFPAYPPGISVTLSTGQTALVIGLTNDMQRPRVKIRGTNELINLETDPNYEKVVITASGISETDFTDEVVTSLNETRSAVKNLREKIIVADENKVALMQVKAALQADYDIITCNNAVAAIDHIKRNGVPDLLIMNVEMSLMGGIEAVKKLNAKGFVVPVIFTTISRERDTVLACRKVGAVDYIVKPVNPTYIQQRVAIALRREREE